jgi:uncharacterized protein (TIGR04255 family)
MSDSSQQKYYSNAPIIEAVIDFQVEKSDIVSDEAFQEIFNKVSHKFPIKTEMSHFQFGVEFGPNQNTTPISTPQTKIGYRLENENNSKVLQVKQQGFTFSYLPPYSNWTEFKTEAEMLWQVYVALTKPTKVIRCAVRYINRLDLSFTPVEIEEFLNIYPYFPKSIPQSVHGMQLHLQMPQDDINAVAIIHEALVDSTVPNGVSILLDLDIVKTLSLEPESIELWDNLEQLRHRKNLLFESFITDKTRELIK